MSRRLVGVALVLFASGSAAGQQPPKNDPFYNPPKASTTDASAEVKKRLRDPDPRVRLKAVEELAAKGEASDSHAGPLCDTVLDSSPQVAAAALRAVEKVCPELFKPLTAAIVDKETKKRIEGVREIGLLEEKGRPAANVLVALLRKELARGPELGKLSALQQELFTALRLVKPDDTASVAFFKTLAAPSNRFPHARDQALGHLHLWAGADEKRRKEILPLVKAGLADEVCRVNCIKHLGEYGPLAKECVPQLKQLKLSSDSAVRDAATEALDKIENR